MPSKINNNEPWEKESKNEEKDAVASATGPSCVVGKSESEGENVVNWIIRICCLKVTYWFSSELQFPTSKIFFCSYGEGRGRIRMSD